MTLPVCVEGLPIPAYWDASGKNFGKRFSVLARTQNDAYDVLESETGIYRGAPFSDGITDDPLYCVCKTLAAEQKTPGSAGTALFELTCIFGFPAVYARPPRAPDSTLRFRTEQALSAEPFDLDRDGNVITNTAGVPFTGLATFAPHFVLVGDWTIFAPDYTTAFTRVVWPYFGKVNSNTFQGAAKNCLRCIDVHIEEANVAYRQAGQTPFAVTARWEFKPQVYVWNIEKDTTGWEGGWRRIIANRGLKQRRSANSAATIAIVDDDGRPIVEPVFLSKTGLAISVAPNSLTPCVVRDEYPEADFNLQVTA